MKIKILSYNIHKGFTTTNQDFILKEIKLAIVETGAEIVLLQEVLGDHSSKKCEISDWETNIQFEYLADRTWFHYAYGKNAIYPNGHHGNAILSKFPIDSWSNQDLTTNRFEKRGLLKANIFLPELDKTILIANTHLNLTQHGRNKQAQMIVESFKNNSETPWILAGDFNDWNKKLCHMIEQQLNATEVFKATHGKVGKTFPSFMPTLSLDRFFSYQIKTISAQVLKGGIWSTLSDHLPLLVEVEIN